jgi:hypothetical protein
MSCPNYEWMKQHLAPLVGCTVTEIVDFGEGYTGIVFEKVSGERFECMLASDMELNDPGFLFIRAATLTRRKRRMGLKK